MGIELACVLFGAASVAMVMGAKALDDRDRRVRRARLPASRDDRARPLDARSVDGVPTMDDGLPSLELRSSHFDL